MQIFYIGVRWLAWGNRMLMPATDLKEREQTCTRALRREESQQLFEVHTRQVS